MKNPLVKVAENHLVKTVVDTAKKHDAALFTAGSIGFGIATNIVVYHESVRIHEIIKVTKETLANTEDPDERNGIIKCALKDLAKPILKISVLAAMSIGCSVGMYKKCKKQDAKIAALTTEVAAATTLAHTTMQEYQEFKKQVVKDVGEEKYKEIENQVTKERIEQDMAEGKITRPIINGDPGIRLICIPHFNIYYYGNPSRIEPAMDRINTCLRYKGGSNGEYCYSQFNELGNPIVMFSDLLDELGANVSEENIGRAAKMSGWNSDEIMNVSYWIGSGYTSSMEPYITLEFAPDSEPRKIF